MSSSSLGATVYSDILQWVNMQQQLEVSGQASTITTAQRKAVKDLHQLIKPRAPIAEPEMGRQDWIGLLNREPKTVSFLLLLGPIWLNSVSALTYIMHTYLQAPQDTTKPSPSRTPTPGSPTSPSRNPRCPCAGTATA